MANFLRSIGSVVRGFGQSLDSFGVSIQGKNAYVERVPIHARLLAIGKAPTLCPHTFVAPNASLIGAVSVGEHASVFYNAIVHARGKGEVKIGEMSSIGDHATVQANDGQVSLGFAVIVGSSASLENCEVQDGAYVGHGAILESGVVVGKNAIIAAGSVVPEGTRIPEGQLWAGAPAQFVRSVEAHESHQLNAAAGGMFWLSQLHSVEASKPLSQVEADQAAYEEEWSRDVDHGSMIHDYEEPQMLPQLANYTYPLQLRTYFEVNAAVPEQPERVITIEKDDDPRKVMEDVLAKQGVRGEFFGKEKKSYWYVN